MSGYFIHYSYELSVSLKEVSYDRNRSFMYVDDCLDGILKLIESDFRDPINIGSSEDVTINQMADILEDISGIKLKRNYK